MKTKKQIIQEIKKSELKQKLIHEHYCSDYHFVSKLFSLLLLFLLL